jgi:drug/metabolite transporter (DMT)-like permease
MMNAKLTAAIASAVIIWGFVFIPLKFLTNGAYTDHPLSPGGFLVLRFAPLLPLFVLVLIARLHREDLTLVRRDAPWFAAMGLLMIPGYHLPLNYALATPLHTGLTSLILNTSPALTYFLAVAFRQERPLRRRTLGVLLAFLGLTVIFGEEIVRNLQGGKGISFSWSGAALLLISALSWALFTLIGRRLGRDHDSRFTFAATGVAGAIAILAVLPLLLGSGGWGQYAALGPLDWASWAYASLLAAFFAYWVWIAALRRIEASRLASAGNLIPLTVHVLAAIFLPAERRAFTPAYLLGAAVTLLGTGLVVGRGARRAEEASGGRGSAKI